ncbi:MAG TPA: NUDIX hydrolase [Chloroflexia bacterium]|nr:NUDIX hydrolase [Chloroflexia bacterium]
MASTGVIGEYSAGGVVYRRTMEGYDIAVVQRARHEDWSLPKGHIEAGESREQAALREVKEETGLDAKIVGELGEVVYFYRRREEGLVRKSVYHYLMEATNDKLGSPNWEVSEVRWVPITEAHTLLSYENDRGIVRKAQSLLITPTS